MWCHWGKFQQQLSRSYKPMNILSNQYIIEIPVWVVFIWSLEELIHLFTVSGKNVSYNPMAHQSDILQTLCRQKERNTGYAQLSDSKLPVSARSSWSQTDDHLEKRSPMGSLQAHSHRAWWLERGVSTPLSDTDTIFCTLWHEPV